MKEKSNHFVIGVDGGGTKTIAALSNLEGKILKIAKAGPSNPRNLPIEKIVFNIAKAIKNVSEDIKKEKIISIFITLAAVQEEYKREKEKIKKGILKILGKSLKAKIEIGSDQVAAFKSGTDQEDGLVLISGTGAVCHGWWKSREAKVSGWGWLNDEGSGFWVGQRALQAVLRELDGRGKKTKITKLIFKKRKILDLEGLLREVYGSASSPQVRKDFVRNVSLMSILVDEASQKGDKIAKEILQGAAEELSACAISVIKKLKIKEEKFPLVFVGKMFESKIVLRGVQKEIKKIAPKVNFIRVKEPVTGAVKLAIERISK